MTDTHVNEPINRTKELSGTTRKGGDAPPEVQQKIVDIIIEEARKRRLNNRDIAYYIAIAKRESGFNPDAANAGSTASGIAQVTDTTAKKYGINDSNRFDARASIQAGLGYFTAIKERITNDYGTSSGLHEPLIYLLYHYGQFIHYNDRKGAKDPKPLSELMANQRYSDSKSVVDEAERIEKILNDSHALRVQLTDIMGKPMAGRKVIVVQKKPKATPASSTGDTVSTAAPSLAPDQTPTRAPATDSTNGQEQANLSETDSEKRMVEDAAHSDSQPTNCEAVPHDPKEWDLVAYEVITDDDGNLPDVESETQEPFVILIPRVEYEAYNDAVSKRLMCEYGNDHEIRTHDGEQGALPATTTQEKQAENKDVEKKFAPSPPKEKSEGSTSKQPPMTLLDATKAAKEKPSSPPSPGPDITFEDVITALQKDLGWKNVYKTSFAYIKQFFTRPKLPASTLSQETAIQPIPTRTQAISSSLQNKETKNTKMKDKVTTSTEAPIKEVKVASDAPWMIYAIQEQKKEVVEIPDDHVSDPQWKVHNKKYKEEEAARKKKEAELKIEQKNKKKTESGVKALEEEIAQHIKARDEALRKMANIERGKNNPDIIKYHKATNLQQRSGVAGADGSSDNTAWCSSFANWCISQAGYKGTRDARAKSWVEWGKALGEPKYGAITVVKRGENAFHVGFFLDIVKLNKPDGFEEVDIGGKKTKRQKYRKVDHIRLLGGNQGSVGRVSESAGWTTEKLVAYRWPTDAEKNSD